MYHTVSGPRWAQRALDRPPPAPPGVAAEQALSRVRKILSAHVPGLPIDVDRLLKALADSPPAPGTGERLFALGFLHWLRGDFVAAEGMLGQAVNRAAEDRNLSQHGEAAYWQARVCIQLGRPEALADYEDVLRKLGGSPQSTAWFVDLLWRTGRVDRAEQVWKSVRTNKRVTGCDEGPLLEARAVLRRGEFQSAERILTVAAPAGGVLQVERLLLLAWVAATQKQAHKALLFVGQAAQGPYPGAALKKWRLAIERQLRDEPPAEFPHPAPRLLTELQEGHAARLAGRNDLAEAAYRQASQLPFAQPFARYGLVSLGQEDLPALLASQPGLFLALRCRALLARERFRLRDSTPAEHLQAYQQAKQVGFQDSASEQFNQIAQFLQTQPELETLRNTVDALTQAGDEVRRNVFRGALEQAARRLPAAEALSLLQVWAQRDWIAADPALAKLVGQQLLRLLLLGQPGAHVDALVAVEKLLPGDPSLGVARSLFDWQSMLIAPAEIAIDQEQPATQQLFLAGVWLAAQASKCDSAALERWRQIVRGLRVKARMRGLAQSLLVHEAAQRGDVNAVAALLGEVDHWHAFGSGPPHFVLESVECVTQLKPNLAILRESLARWLQSWDLPALGEPGLALAQFAGLVPVKASETAVPPGVGETVWFLHQASRLLGQDDAEALACMRRALNSDPELMNRPPGEFLKAALPEMERRARAYALAKALDREGNCCARSLQLVDAADLLDTFPEGRAILQSAQDGDIPAAKAGLVALAERSDLPPRLVHHLAIIELRAAEKLQDQGDTAEAEPHWRRAWRYWCVHFARMQNDIGKRLLFDHLLGIHRNHFNALLAREAMDAARRHWDMVQQLPNLAGAVDKDAGIELEMRVTQFKDRLATDYLVTTREAMRYGIAPEGCQTDYDRGLGHLRRLLSLDNENVRLLTAFVEICNEWFLDLYRVQAGSMLTDQVHRFVPFAAKLSQLVADRPAELSARAALADFNKFRGFVQRDREKKAAFYREALRLNPGNDNVRELLGQLQPPGEQPPAGATPPNEPPVQ